MISALIASLKILLLFMYLKIRALPNIDNNFGSPYITHNAPFSPLRSEFLFISSVLILNRFSQHFPTSPLQLVLHLLKRQTSWTNNYWRIIPDSFQAIVWFKMLRSKFESPRRENLVHSYRSTTGQHRFLLTRSRHFADALHPES